MTCTFSGACLAIYRIILYKNVFYASAYTSKQNDQFHCSEKGEELKRAEKEGKGVNYHI